MTDQWWHSDLPTRLQRIVLARPLTDEVQSWCWVWQGALDRGGYAQAGYQGKKWYVHLLTVHLAGLPQPTGLQADHLCNRRACINPYHIEFVTKAVNTQRSWRRGRPLNGQGALNASKTHCVNGHEFTSESTVRESKCQRRCRVCKNTRERERKKRVRHG